MPNVDDLTKEVKEKINDKNFEELLDENDNVEVILNKLQQLKSLITDKKHINNLSLDNIITLEKETKETIFTKLSEKVDFDKLCSLVIWLNYINQEKEKEIFTLNYDLLLEKALEKVSLPYFTGFIGNVKPFFISDSVDMIGLDDSMIKHGVHSTIVSFVEQPPMVIRSGGYDVTELKKKYIPNLQLQ